MHGTNGGGCNGAETTFAVGLGQHMGAIETFIEGCRGRGMTPADAMLLYRERRLFAFEQWIAPDEALKPEVRRMVEMRTNIVSFLDTVSTQEDMEEYARNWVAIARGKPFLRGSMVSSTSKDDGAIYDEIMADGCAGYLCAGDNTDVIARICGGLRFSPEWIQTRAMVDSWDDVAYVMKKEQSPGLECDDSGAASAMDIEALERTAAKTGLRALSWCGVESGGATKAVISKLDTAITNAEATLSQTTGLTGEVFGLKGRIRLAVGLLGYGQGAFFDHENETGENVCIVTACDCGMGPVAHEWLHALDAIMGYQSGCNWRGMASEASHAVATANQGIAPWKRLLGALNGGGKAKEIRANKEAAMATAARTMVRRWTLHTPKLAENLDIEGFVEASLKPDWNRKKAAGILEAALAATHGKDKDIKWLGECYLTELDMVHRHSREVIDSPDSLWLTFRKQLEENVKKLPLKRDGKLIISNGYLNEPTEVLAHAFEMQMPRSAAIGDVFAGGAGMRYPMLEEALAQTVGWSAFFKSIRPYWEKLPSMREKLALSAAPKIRLGERLKAYAKGAASGEVGSVMTPMAVAVAEARKARAPSA